MNVDRLPLSNTTHIGILDSLGERVVLIEDLRRHLRVDALIRLHSDEFALLTTDCRSFVHFNLEFTLNEVGRHYAIVPIVRAGKRLPDGREVLPLIDPAPARRGICAEVIQSLPLDKVTPALFASSLPNIRTQEQLRAALLNRYERMFPHLSKEEILERGCAVTRITFDDEEFDWPPVKKERSNMDQGFAGEWK